MEERREQHLGQGVQIKEEMRGSRGEAGLILAAFRNVDKVSFG